MGFITPQLHLFSVTNILSFSLIIVCEWFQNEQTIPDGSEYSRLICLEHYVILKEGWKCLSVYNSCWFVI